MNPPEQFEIGPTHATFRPVGKMTWEQALSAAEAAIAYARAQQVGRLLVDSTGISGFPFPTTMERYDLGERIARAAGGQVTIAVVARPELIDPEHFAMVVASNRGLLVDVFATEGEALTWLLRSTARTRPETG